ncbi:MAG: hypothetical protein JXA18_08690, partial [Chitinispirillaceae bacterium]|nr:hypothetical protein [Chitinispirillaceae bacterium]
TVGAAQQLFTPRIHNKGFHTLPPLFLSVRDAARLPDNAVFRTSRNDDRKQKIYCVTKNRVV